MKSFFRKVLYSILTIYLAVTAIFFVLRLTPGDPVERILGPDSTYEERNILRAELGLDKSVSHQYWNFLGDLFNNDMGVSLFKKKPVTELIEKHFVPTLAIALISISFSSFFGIFLGVLSGARKGEGIDSITRILSLLFLSLPIFSLAPMLVLIFSIKLRILPVSEWGGLKHIVLPSLTLIIPLTSVLIRVGRSKYLEERTAPWARVLNAKGLSSFQILVRLTKVCLPTIFNVVAIQLSVVLSGTMITETIFDIPGMGMLLFESIQNRDYPVIQGIIVYSTIVYMLIYFTVDYLNEKIDPRIKAL